MLKCNAPRCTTDENTQIDGKSLTLFSFPTYDAALVKLWHENSKLNNVPEENAAELKFCELHFEPDAFVNPEKNALTPGAVPTIFESLETEQKRSLDDDEKVDNGEEPPVKQIKSEETEPPKREEAPAVEPSIKCEPVLSPTVGGPSLFTKQIDMGKKVYRLIIRIDRVIEPGDVKTESKPSEKLQSALSAKATEPPTKNGGTFKPCSKTGCKLIKTVLNSKPVFQCERCNKYYVVKESKSDVSTWTCYICQEVLSSPDALSNHVRTHYTCDMCQAQCSTQISFDKHVRLHVSTDPLLPYKCNRCSNTYEVKAEVRQHYLEKHSKSNAKPEVPSIETSGQASFRCKYCYAVFKKEQAYKSHVNLHVKGTGGFDCALCNKSFKTAKHHADHQARHLSTMKSTCRVCNKEFSGSEEIEAHMKTHLKVQRLEAEVHKCSVCGKVFKNENTLGSHMQGHLSRAHRCPICNKAFVNKTTLSIHLKTHSKESFTTSNSTDSVEKKKHSCTLCLGAFDSRSKLYNHIMTHLEKMHGTEGEVVLDGLGEMLESDEYILS